MLTDDTSRGELEADLFRYYQYRLSWMFDPNRPLDSCRFVSNLVANLPEDSMTIRRHQNSKFTQTQHMLVDIFEVLNQMRLDGAIVASANCEDYQGIDRPPSIHRPAFVEPEPEAPEFSSLDDIREALGGMVSG